jgi:hypothetical protein
MTKNWIIFTAEEKFNIFLIGNRNLLIRTSKLQEKPSAVKKTSSTSKHEITKLFLFLWAILAHLDPDPDPLT